MLLAALKSASVALVGYACAHRSDIAAFYVAHRAGGLAGEALRCVERTAVFALDAVRSRSGVALGVCLIVGTVRIHNKIADERERALFRHRALFCVFTPVAVACSILLVQEHAAGSDDRLQRAVQLNREVIGAYEGLCRSKMASGVVVHNSSALPLHVEARSQWPGMTKLGGGANQVVVAPGEMKAVSANLTTNTMGRGVRLCITGTERCVDADHGQFVVDTQLAR